MSLRYWSCIAALYFVAKGFTGESQVTLAPPPEVRSQNHIASLTLHAALNISGRDAFAYEAKYRLISSRRPKSTDAPSFLVVTSKPSPNFSNKKIKRLSFRGITAMTSSS